MSSKVKVVVRARPTSNFDAAMFRFNEDSDSIDVINKDNNTSNEVAHNSQDSWHFKVNKNLLI